MLSEHVAPTQSLLAASGLFGLFYSIYFRGPNPSLAVDEGKITPSIETLQVKPACVISINLLSDLQHAQKPKFVKNKGKLNYTRSAH